MLIKRSGAHIKYAQSLAQNEVVLTNEFQPLFDDVVIQFRAPWRTTLKALLTIPAIHGYNANSTVELSIFINQVQIGNAVKLKVGNVAMPFSATLSAVEPLNVNPHQDVAITLMARTVTGNATIDGEFKRKILLESIER
ncbi:hypothetical protein QYZ44_21540 [Vibrio parahaemolyticus]|nr:hypothetical protein [Vibrio parahaemolyticus]MDN4711618.1 hypothetical protein [Vibrio parahaemolyticus]